MSPRFTKIAGIATFAAAAAAAALTACVDMSAPKNAPASISSPQLPGLFVVRGDMMRDSLGNPFKPVILTYDANGNPVADFTPTFFLSDSNAAAHFNADGVLVGDRLGTVHLIGQIGNLQTTALAIAVTVAPTKLVPSKTDTIAVPINTSDTTKAIGYQAAAATVRGASPGDTTVQGLIVRYTLVRPLESTSDTQPAVYLTDEQGNLSSVDTSDAGGLVSRRVVVVSSRLKDPAVRSGQKTDSVVVEARAKYRGVDLAGSPARFVLPVKVTFALK